jgi:hypothetical protein
VNAAGSHAYLLVLRSSCHPQDGPGARFFNLAVRGGPAGHKTQTADLAASLKSHFGSEVEINGSWSGRVYGRILRPYRETESVLRDLDAAAAKANLPLAVPLGIDLITTEKLLDVGCPWHTASIENEFGCHVMFDPARSEAHLAQLRAIWEPLWERWLYPRHRLVGAARLEGFETLYLRLPPLETMIARAVVYHTSLRRESPFWVGALRASYGASRVRQALDSLHEAGLLVEVWGDAGADRISLRRGPLAGRIGKNWLLRL